MKKPKNIEWERQKEFQKDCGPFSYSYFPNLDGKYCCRFCGKEFKKKIYGFCSEKCFMVNKEKEAKEKAEFEASEKVRRAKIATVGDIEDLLKDYFVRYRD